MLILIGYVVILISVFGGFALSGGHLAAIFQPVELLIIGGAAIGALISANSWPVIKSICKSIPMILKKEKNPKEMYSELLSLLYKLLSKGRQDGLMALESDIDDPKNSEIFKNFPKITSNHYLLEFICDYFRLIITANMEAYKLEALMDSEIATLHAEELIPANAIVKLGDGMPAFGIVAAVLGVVHTMESINLPPAELGALVGRALVGTFLGILLGYGFISPIANALEQRANNMQLMFNCIKVVLLASLNDNSPSVSLEFGRKVLFTSARPSFYELTEQIKNSAAKTTVSTGTNASARKASG